MLKRAVFLFLFLLIPSVSFGASFVTSPLRTDTGSGTSSQELGRTTASTIVAQSVVFDTDITIPTILVKLKKTGAPTDNLTVSIYDNTGVYPSSSLGTSGTIAGTTLTTSDVYYAFTFSTPLTLTAYDQYFITVTRSGAVDNVNYYGVGYNSATYEGQMYIYNTGVWTIDTTHRTLKFQIYYSQSAPSLGTITAESMTPEIEYMLIVAFLSVVFLGTMFLTYKLLKKLL